MTESTLGQDVDSPPLKGSALADESFRLVRRDFPKLWLFWLLASLAAGSVLVLGRMTQVEHGRTHIDIWPQRLGYDLFVAVGPAIPGSLAIRAVLSGAPRWDVDWRLLGSVALVAGSTLASLLFGDLNTLILPLVPPLLGLVLSLTVLGIMIAQIWVCARLVLWPVGWLMGDESMTATKSWRLMRGSLGAFIAGVILVCAAPAIAGLIFYGSYRHDGALWRVVAAAPFQGLAGLLSAVLVAVLYRRMAMKPVS